MLFRSDPSFGYMLAASRDTINTTPPLYFVLCWGWARIFGDSELALRMFSSLSVCGAFWVMWKVLRPKYGFFAASASLVAAFLGRPLLVQNGEARFYGLYLLACAMAIERYDRLSNKDQLTWKDYLLNFLAHAALVFTHTFGFFYSFCVLLISFLFRMNRKRDRKSVV